MVKDKDSAARDVLNGLPLVYNVRFPLSSPLPKVTAIYLNNQVLCSGPKGCLRLMMFYLILKLFLSSRNWLLCHDYQFTAYFLHKLKFASANLKFPGKCWKRPATSYDSTESTRGMKCNKGASKKLVY